MGRGQVFKLHFWAVGMEFERDWNGGGVGESVVDGVAKLKLEDLTPEMFALIRLMRTDSCAC